MAFYVLVCDKDTTRLLVTVAVSAISVVSFGFLGSTSYWPEFNPGKGHCSSCVCSSDTEMVSEDTWKGWYRICCENICKWKHNFSRVRVNLMFACMRLSHW